MNRLAIFDIDGTLTDTNDVDDECYRISIGEALGVSPAAIDWSDATHVTDAGIFHWLCEHHRKTLPTPVEIAKTRRRFVDRLAQALDDEPARFCEIPGAARVMPALLADGWCIAVATGCWGPSARLKLRAAGIEIPDVVIACADDAIARTDIVQLARARAEALYGAFGHVVSIGDAPWDVRAARALRLPFLGIASGQRASTLRQMGARAVFADYSDIEAFRNALAFAAPPL